MTAETDLPPLPERFDCTNGSAQWCYGCYTMTRDDLGDYVLAEDYDALRNASEALQAEIEALRLRIAGLRQVAENDRARAERLEEALREARDAIEDWAGYASDYFREKHDLAGDLAKIDALLRDQEEGHER